MASAKCGAHKALRRCASGEKHPVLRVGGAEGAQAHVVKLKRIAPQKEYRGCLAELQTPCTKTRASE